jgi:hypothetical protein
MKVSCPHCGITGNVDEERLQASSGRLRCPGCKEDFTVSLSQEETDLSGFETPRDEDILVTDDIHAAHADAMEAAMSESIHDVLPDDIPDEFPGATDGATEPGGMETLGELPTSDTLMPDSDIDDFPDIPDDLEYEGESLNEFGVPEQAPTAPESPVIPETPAPDTGSDIIGEDDLDDEPLILEEVIEEDDTKADKKATRIRRKFFTMPSLPSGTQVAERISVLRSLLAPILLVILLAIGAFLGVSRFYLPLKAENTFLNDSRAMFEHYRRLDIFLDVGVSDSDYIASLAETAYNLMLYREEHGTERGQHPLYTATTITGDLFLATDSFIDRIQEPDLYAGVEWGSGLAYTSRDAYAQALLEEMSRCFFQIDVNMLFLRGYYDTTTRVKPLPFLFNRAVLLDHFNEAENLEDIHREFLSTPSELRFFSDIIAGIEKDLVDLR